MRAGILDTGECMHYPLDQMARGHAAGGDRRPWRESYPPDCPVNPMAIDSYERSDPHPLGHRAGRPERRRAAPAAGLRRAAQAGRPEAGAGEARGRRSRPRPWSTRRTSGWSARATAEPWDGRGHFFAAAAEAMRRILVDRAPRPQAAASGAAAAPSSARPRRASSADDAPPDDLLALDEALERLARRSTARAAELVKLRYFAGLTLDEAAAGPGHLRRHRRARLGLRPGLAVQRARPRRSTPEKISSRGFRARTDALRSESSTVAQTARMAREPRRWTRRTRL